MQSSIQALRSHCLSPAFPTLDLMGDGGPAEGGQTEEGAQESQNAQAQPGSRWVGGTGPIIAHSCVLAW